MAIRKCSDCGEAISTRALACPHCGGDRRVISWDEERQRRGDYWLYTLLIALALWGYYDWTGL